MNPFSMQIDELLKQMTLDEKVGFCHAASKFSVKGIDRLGIPDMVMSDGPHGVRREISADCWDPVDTDTDFSTYLPTGTALAATWNTEMAKLHGEVLGAESRERGKDVILGPGFNIVRSPLCGRNFEYYSEDPCHIAKLVPHAVKGIQSQGTAACAKHYALNSQELNRCGVNTLVSERALREIYLPGFEAAVKEGGALTIMGAYNKFRGQWCCQNDYLLNQILKEEWGFAGATISDWNGVHNTYEAAYCGMDIEMGTDASSYENYYLSKPFKSAIENGEIEEDIVNDKVRRILYVLFSIGAIGEKKDSRPSGERNTKKHHQAALNIAREAIVLLKNKDNILPFDPLTVKKVLVIGDNAKIKHHSGGNSSAVKALYETTPLDAISKLLGDGVEVEHIQDPTPGDGFDIPTDILSPADLGAGVNGWRGEIYNFRGWGGESSEDIALNVMDFNWQETLPECVKDPENWSAKFTTTLTAPQTGSYTFVLLGTLDAALKINDADIICRRENEYDPNIVSAKINLEKGEKYNLVLHVIPGFLHSLKKVKLTWLSPADESEVSFEQIQKKAIAADNVIYIGGLSHNEDTEGKDRLSLNLPGMQDEVISKLLEVRPDTAILMTGGSPYSMPWINQAKAVIHMWYGGMEGANAAAEVIFGKINPSGKLPFTFPAKLEDSPAHALDDYHADVCYYKEDIFVGYRWFEERKIKPLFAFGHGLSYTTFEYSALSMKTGSKGTVEISFTLTNTGSTSGSEVAQLYITDCECSVRRPQKELKNFTKVFLQSGESKQITLELTEKDLSFFHPSKRKWICESGEFIISIASASNDVRLSSKLNYTK